jgi:signal transduction histidine kinase
VSVSAPAQAPPPPPAAAALAGPPPDPIDAAPHGPVPGGPHLLRSAGVRFAAIYAGLLAVSALALAAFLWWATAGLLERQIDAAIRADIRGLAERWDDGKIQALALTIDDRLLQNVDDDAIYLLVDPGAHRLAGNLASWPPGVTSADGSYELAVSRAGVRSLARVQEVDLPGGFRLLVGRDVEGRARMRSLLTDALTYAMIVVVVMASVGALVVRDLFRRALSSVSETAAAIAAGDLTRRVRVSRRHDEFDQLAETINDMLDRIGRLMDGVRQVSNAIAHDLRTPITRARTRLEDASLHARTPEELRAAIDRATADLDGIVAVFQALLRIAEIEAGARRSAFARVDAGPVLSGLAELYGAAAEERGLTLRLDRPPPLPLYGDRDLIQQAVANLLDNAIKFSPEGGAVRLAGRLVPGGVEIVVADEGPGIAPEERGHATERFFRGETARSTPGAGLGLALVQAVAQLHGGSLALEDARPGLRAVLTLQGEAAT